LHKLHDLHLAGWNIDSPLKPIYNTRSGKRQMENEERAQLEAQHQKEVDNLKEEVARLTSLLEQTLRDKSRKQHL
jgi:hypothetical protein